MRKSDKTVTSGDTLDSFDDQIDLIEHLVEDSNNWLASDPLDFRERYQHAKVELVMRIRAGDQGEKLDLLYRAVPDGVVWHNEGSSGPQSVDNNSGMYSHRGNDSVRIHVTCFIECPQEFISIPSLVRLEPANNRVDLLRDDLSPSVEIVVDVAQLLPERKVDVPGVGPRCGNDRVHGVIQSSPEITDSIPYQVGNGIAHWLDEPDFVQKVVGGIHVYISSVGPMVFIQKGTDLPIKVENVFFTPCELAT